MKIVINVFLAFIVMQKNIKLKANISKELEKKTENQIEGFKMKICFYL